jgi:mRNA interferase RelE/StbE
LTAFKVLISKKALKYIEGLEEKSQRSIKEKCLALGNCPFSGNGCGDKELLNILDHTLVYRLHIGRSYTAFYGISEEEHIVHIRDIMTI